MPDIALNLPRLRAAFMASSLIHSGENWFQRPNMDGSLYLRGLVRYDIDPVMNFINIDVANKMNTPAAATKYRKGINRSATPITRQRKNIGKLKR